MRKDSAAASATALGWPGFRSPPVLEPVMPPVSDLDPTLRSALLDLSRSYHPPGDPYPWLTPWRLEDLGDPGFRAAHRVRFNVMSGAMANGIASVELVEAMARGGMVGIFGAAGLGPERVAAALDRLQTSLGDRLPWGVNLIHSPNEPALEEAVAALLIARGVRLVEASAYLDLTPAIVRYRLAGLEPDPADPQRGRPRHRVIAKVSRVEVAAKFLGPPPPRLVAKLLDEGAISPLQARLAPTIPMADDLTAEADSGGHTDNQPLVALLPALLELRDRESKRHGWTIPPRVGAAGGIATPAAAAAALAMGADYLVTGSVNQACVESGTSPIVRRMLAEARQGDLAMAPAADMFEMGVKVQVLKRGTLFPLRAAKLYEWYRNHESLDHLSQSDRDQLERTILRQSIEAVWEQTQSFFQRRDPRQLERAARDPKHKMALVFRWYLGLSSHWANSGQPDRVVDYQIWCGPAMAAFNAWVEGSHLESPENRRAAEVALQILHGAAVLLRSATLQGRGRRIPGDWIRPRPLPPEELLRRLRSPHPSATSPPRTAPPEDPRSVPLAPSLGVR
ncbi:PfaD family polyunsaturated fatty acid/polyketide biosynthesis protein [Isosphaera pallida]|nr:PfaD family polyunsaturated fatty acid/polyketide biosynthesis protein [Isosphaera pallida]